MIERMYDDLASWWSVLTPTAHYADDAARYTAWLQAALPSPMRSLLELGSAGGQLASHVPTEIDVVLVDRAPAMLACSEPLNPGRRHVCADMRTLRLDARFDAVLLHDAVMYLTNEQDLRATFTTAFAHLRPGGVMLVVPDVIRETFEEGMLAGGGDDGVRAAQLLEWHWDPDPEDSWYQVEFSYLLRETDGTVRSVHETHRMGLFDTETWWSCLLQAGFEPVAQDPMEAAERGLHFLVRRPV